MFVRVETGYKAEFSDPEAHLILKKMAEIHAPLAEKVRWIRKLKVIWMEFDTPRDKLVQAIQLCFKNKVTDWVFTGDLLPSAAGSTGTLYDLMQESPFRPGVFHGIEKRKRLTTHDEDGLVICDAMQTLLGRKLPQDRVVTGEMLLVEGVKLLQSDLEWIARNWFAQERVESWSLLSEEELKRNSRFQSEQVGKYLVSPLQANRSRLLQFRSNTGGIEPKLEWKAVESLLQSPLNLQNHTVPMIQSEEWSFRPDVRFSSASVQVDTLTETEFQLCRHQLDHFTHHGSMRLQTVLAVLPERMRLWRSELEGDSPLRIRDDFERSLERVAQTTDTPIALMKVFEEWSETSPSYFWTSNISLEDPRFEPHPRAEKDSILDLVFVGFQDQQAIRNLTFFETLKGAYLHGLRGEAISFAVEATGRTLLECLKSSPVEARYGFDLVLDGVADWFKRSLKTPLSLGFFWGVSSEKREWLLNELRLRGIPFTHFGSTTLTGDVRIFEGGELKAKVNIQEFFNSNVSGTDDSNLLDEAIFVSEDLKAARKFQNRFSTEELILRPESYHMKIAAPVVVRPELNSWSGLVVLSDLAGVEFNDSYLDFVLRKCTAMGGQIQAVQVSFLNGLKAWAATLKKLEKEFGIRVTETERLTHPEIQAHWMALQVISKVSDVRTVRTEEFKFANDRIYWLPGDFEQAGTRWLAGFEGRYQTGLHSAIAIEMSEEGQQSVINALTHALQKRKLGAEVRIQHHFPGGFFVSVSENERFAVEEEWRVVGVEFEFVGRVTSYPYLVLRDEQDQVQTLAIEDIL